MKRSPNGPSKRHLDALARSGSETSLARPVPRGLSHSYPQSASATDLHREQGSLDLPTRLGGGLQRTPSRGSLAKSLKQLPPLNAPSAHRNPRAQSDSRLGREQKESTKKDGGGLKNQTGYGAALDAFKRPPVDDVDEFEALTKEKFEREAKAFRESTAQAAKMSEGTQRAETTSASAERECVTDMATGQDTQEDPTSSSHCYFKPNPMGAFGDLKVPEKPAGPPPMSEAEKDLMAAVCGGDLQKAEELLTEHGPSLLSGHGGGGITTTAILYAAQSGNKEMCDLLVARGGPEVLEKARDIKNKGPAEYAAKGGHEELASHLKNLESKTILDGIKAQESKKVVPFY